MTEALIVALLVAAAPAHAARRPAPEARALLREAVSPPSAARTARVRVQSFDAAGKAKAQYRVETVRPDGERRVEASSKRGGPPALTVVSDGRSVMTAVTKTGKTWTRAVADDREAELVRLASLYDMAVSTGGRVAGKAAWRLDLRSKADGRVRRSFWLGKSGAGLLRREDYRPDGSLLRRERVTRLLPAAEADFTVAPGASRRGWLPDGFVTEDGGASFTDGLRTILFERAPAAAAGRPYAEVRLKAGVGRLYAVNDGVALVWSGGVLTGDAPEADLARIADSLEAR